MVLGLRFSQRLAELGFRVLAGAQANLWLLRNEGMGKTTI